MRRIIAQTKVTNLFDETKFVECGMLVDTGAAALVLPAAWKERLGEFPRQEAVELILANGEVVRGEACAPVEIKIEGFRPVVNEVMFVATQDDAEEPLLGYVILEQAQAAVDRLEHRPVPRQGRPVVRIARFPAGRRQRKLGDFAGQIRMSEDFDDWPPDLQQALGMAEPQ